MEQILLVEAPISEFEQSVGLRVHLVRVSVKASDSPCCKVCKAPLPEGKGSRTLCKLHGGRGFKRDKTW